MCHFHGERVNIDTRELSLPTARSVTQWNSDTSLKGNINFFQGSYSFTSIKKSFYLDCFCKEGERNWVCAADTETGGRTSQRQSESDTRFDGSFLTFSGTWLLNLAGMFNCSLNAERSTPEDLTNTSGLERFSPRRQLEILSYLVTKSFQSHWSEKDRSHFFPQAILHSHMKAQYEQKSWESGQEPKLERQCVCVCTCVYLKGTSSVSIPISDTPKLNKLQNRGKNKTEFCFFIFNRYYLQIEKIEVSNRTYNKRWIFLPHSMLRALPRNNCCLLHILLEVISLYVGISVSLFYPKGEIRDRI